MSRNLTPEARIKQAAILRTEAQKRSQKAYDKTQAALERMKKAGDPLTISGLAREAGVSRKYLKGHSHWRKVLERQRSLIAIIE
ncbi:DUF6262 family protein [Rothia nasimurium]|uniref:DUF6262 family protein n=1 Tax=Rothia nasimurium TaxID=85336 RepID=UPI00361E2C30